MADQPRSGSPHTVVPELRLYIPNPLETCETETILIKSLNELKRLGWPKAHNIQDILTKYISNNQYAELVISGLLGGALISFDQNHAKKALEHMQKIMPESALVEISKRIQLFYLDDRFAKFQDHVKGRLKLRS